MSRRRATRGCGRARPWCGSRPAAPTPRAGGPRGSSGTGPGAGQRVAVPRADALRAVPPAGLGLDQDHDADVDGDVRQHSRPAGQAPQLAHVSRVDVVGKLGELRPLAARAGWRPGSESGPPRGCARSKAGARRRRGREEPDGGPPAPTSGRTCRRQTRRETCRRRPVRPRRARRTRRRGCSARTGGGSTRRGRPGRPRMRRRAPVGALVPPDRRRRCAARLRPPGPQLCRPRCRHRGTDGESSSPWHPRGSRRPPSMQPASRPRLRPGRRRRPQPSGRCSRSGRRRSRARLAPRHGSHPRGAGR